MTAQITVNLGWHGTLYISWNLLGWMYCLNRKHPWPHLISKTHVDRKLGKYEKSHSNHRDMPTNLDRIHCCFFLNLSLYRFILLLINQFPYVYVRFFFIAYCSFIVEVVDSRIGGCTIRAHLCVFGSFV